jgi:UDP:flavonoid glycosyltransferase YjiC (YdhE family)
VLSGDPNRINFNGLGPGCQADDKFEIAARVAWSGAGIKLATDNPSSPSIRAASCPVWDEPQFRARAKAFEKEFARHETEEQIVRHILQARRRNAATLQRLVAPRQVNSARLY